jgi:cell division protein FtsB
MVFDTHYSRLKRRAIIGVLACLVVGYFAFHAFNGDHGIFANARYEERVAGLKAQLAGLRSQRQDLDHHIALLKPESLDPDLLEEQARGTLNLAHPRDVLVMMKR